MKIPNPVSLYARMWPREVFDCKRGKSGIVRELDILSKSGVYVLYRDDLPYYVGKATLLRKRLWSHANRPNSKYYNHWNYFSVFAVEDKLFRSQLEGVLIAAMPTANGARPRIRKAQLPPDVRKLLHRQIHEPIQLKAKALAKAAAQN